MLPSNEDEFDKLERNWHNIIRRLAEINAKLSAERRTDYIKDDFYETVAETPVRLIRGIVSQTDIPRDQRRLALKRIYDEMIKAMDEVEKIDLPNVYWRERGKDRYYMLPSDFVMKYYPDYRIITMLDIKDHDPDLYQALNNQKKKKGFPEGFSITTDRDRNTMLLEELGDVPTLERIKENCPPHIRDQIRAHQFGLARQSRMRRR